MLFNQTVFDAKTKYRETLAKKLAAAYNQLSEAVDAVAKVSINEQIKSLDDEFKSIDTEVEELEKIQLGSNRFYGNAHRVWESNIHKIDFAKSKKIFDSVLGRLKNQEGAALFLIQNSHSMGGKWCVRNLWNRLQEAGTCHPPMEFKISHYQKGISTTFLNQIAERLGVQPNLENTQQYVDEIVRSICDSLHGGQVLLFQVEIPCLDQKDNFLSWFINDFWSLLIRQLSLVSLEHPQIKVFGVVAVRGSVSKTCLPETLCCKPQQFSSDKALELPLQNWTDTEIKNWLISFSGLMSSMGRSRSEVEQIARSVHQISKGRPIDVYHELMEAMSLKVG